MKKQLLFVAAMFIGIAASAQTVVWHCTADADGNVDIAGNVTGSTTISADDATCGTGLAVNSAHQATHKDAAGASLNYFDDGRQVVKFVPTSAEAIKIQDDAYAAQQYVDFSIIENDNAKYLDINTVKFGVVRFGTDAVRINAKLIYGTDDGDVESDWLITGDNWESVCGGEGAWTEPTGAEGEIAGYAPVRENGTADLDYDGFAHVNLPLTDKPENIYSVTLRILVYGIANNKQFGLNDVTISSESTGVNGIQATESVVEGKTYDLGGRPATKGLLIQKGKAKRFVK